MAQAVEARSPSIDDQPQASSSRSPPQPPNPRPHRSAEDGARGKRLLGMLNATLGQAKRQAEAHRTDAKRRATIDARSQARLDKERRDIDAKQSLQRQCQKELALVHELVEGEAAHRSLRAQKRRLASFLVTSSPGLVRGGERQRHPSRSGRHVDGPSSSSSSTPHPMHNVAPSVPSSLPPPTSRSDYERKRWPVYYLPRKLTAQQEDMLDDQEDRVDAEIDEADRLWQERKGRMEDELQNLRERAQEMATRLEREANGGEENQQEEGRKLPRVAPMKGDEEQSQPSGPVEGGMDVDDGQLGSNHHSVADIAPVASAAKAGASTPPDPTASIGPPQDAAASSKGQEDDDAKMQTAVVHANVGDDRQDTSGPPADSVIDASSA